MMSVSAFAPTARSITLICVLDLSAFPQISTMGRGVWGLREKERTAGTRKRNTSAMDGNASDRVLQSRATSPTQKLCSYCIEMLSGSPRIQPGGPSHKTMNTTSSTIYLAITRPRITPSRRSCSSVFSRRSSLGYGQWYLSC